MEKPIQSKLKAIIVDLDGVLTKTSKQHKQAWKQAFDQYNDRREQRGEKRFLPFSEEKDYPNLIDGLPRNAGINRFLESRGIILPPGDPEDGRQSESVWGIGNLKNHFYQELISREGVTVFRENVERVRSWKLSGIQTAVVSSSKNCREILEKAGLVELFDVRIDGDTAAQKNLPGKPSPDLFLLTSEKLGVPPEQTVLVEDALSGVEAGKKGGFGLIVGILGAADSEDLRERGADVVVANLEELDLEFCLRSDATQLPSAISNFSKLTRTFQRKRPLFFLDFDGTLSPIVENHQDAFLSEEMKELVAALARKYPVAIVSGRGLVDVRERVGLKNLFYAGSHGFEISGPDGYSKDQEEAVKIIPVFNQIEPILRKHLGHIEGVDFERKKYTLAIHYRKVEVSRHQEIHEIVSGVLKDYPDLLKAGGKMVIEIRPAVDWHKGKAVAFLKNELTPEKDPFSVYIGDDLTDEDAFENIGHGIGILVGDHGKKTAANYHLEDLEEVKRFLRLLIHPEKA